MMLSLFSWFQNFFTLDLLALVHNSIGAENQVLRFIIAETDGLSVQYIYSMWLMDINRKQLFFVVVDQT
jgi:hypothetical protein